MDSEEDFINEDVCRICRSVNVANLVGIFEDRERMPMQWEGGKLEPVLADILNECADCMIKPKDALPQKICRSCISAARQTFQFKRMCEQSYQFFKQRLKVGNLRELDLALSFLLDPLTGVKVEASEEESIVSKETRAEEQQNQEEDVVDEILEEKEAIEDEYKEPEKKKPSDEPEKKKPSDEIKDNSIPEDKVKTRSARAKSASSLQQLATDTFHCPHCTKTFEQKSYLRKHMKRHTDEKSFICPTCDKSFFFKTHLVTHMRVHTGERKFKCQDCSLSFAHNYHLKDHQKIHTGIKPFQCPHCPRTFTQRSNLKLHINLHTDKGKYKCPDCSKSFSMKCALTKHLPVHADEKPFKCCYCPKSYTKRNSLKRHERDHTGELYRCTLCPHVFKELYKLRRHSKNVHSVNLNDIDKNKIKPKVAVGRVNSNK
ncbi:zinc finger protein 771-like [Drosophila tropicalis]|uniref:zinc finger protein 771-like n=1 Tax=Drosophila tropicalis TaxID=46794 RepID=UPI0035AC13AE